MLKSSIAGMDFSHGKGTVQQQGVFHPLCPGHLVTWVEPLGRQQQQQRHFPVLTETE